VQFGADELRHKVEPVFQQNFQTFGELGAALSVWQNGRSVLELHGGHCDGRREQPWTDDTLVLVWSATKGIGSACLLHALQESGIDLGRRVAEFWPNFAQTGKQEIQIGQVMSHGAGLCALDTPVEVTEYEAVVEALEKQTPFWKPATAHGYHARTYGFLIDELVRRITGLTISEYWRKFFGEPLRLDFWIGLPPELNSRVATIYAGRAAGATPEPAKFYRDLTTPGTLQRKVFTSPQGLQSISAMNRPEIRALPIVSFGGIGSATALAKFYGMLANQGVMDGRRYFEARTLQWMKTPISSGIDRVFEIPTTFSAGFMMGAGEAKPALCGGHRGGFGHPGAGGSHAFADPANGIGFAYVMNQMERSLLPTAKALRLVDTVCGLVQAPTIT
jgi:CubicO group peptidase (beta-lactamase class C family)